MIKMYVLGLLLGKCPASEFGCCSVIVPVDMRGVITMGIILLSSIYFPVLLVGNIGVFFLKIAFNPLFWILCSLYMYTFLLCFLGHDKLLEMHERAFPLHELPLT